MSTTQQVVQVALWYDGRVFVPDRPFAHMPVGTVIKVWTTTEPTDWPSGYLESTMGQGPDLEEPEDPPFKLGEEPTCSTRTPPLALQTPSRSFRAGHHRHLRGR